MLQRAKQSLNNYAQLLHPTYMKAIFYHWMQRLSAGLPPFPVLLEILLIIWAERD